MTITVSAKTDITANSIEAKPDIASEYYDK
jgi:hypothetical protein